MIRDAGLDISPPPLRNGVLLLNHDEIHRSVTNVSIQEHARVPPTPSLNAKPRSRPRGPNLLGGFFSYDKQPSLPTARLLGRRSSGANPRHPPAIPSAADSWRIRVNRN